MKRLTFLLPFLLIATSAHAACTGGSPTWTSTPDQPSVATCIASASTGDTINISAGSSTWTTGVTISGKALHINGAGSGRIIALDNGTDVHTIATGALTINIAKYSPGFSSSSITPGQTLRVFQSNAQDNWMQGTVTSITGNVLVMNITSTNGTSTTHRWLVSTLPTTIIVQNSSATLFSISEDTALHTSISGIQFAIAVGNHGCCAIQAINMINSVGGQAILIHDNWFQWGTGVLHSIEIGTNSGVIWNNSFNSSSYSNTQMSIGGGFRVGIFPATSAQNAWLAASFWGTLDTTGQHNVYVETNDFHTQQAMNDNDNNARTVFRYNLVDHSIFATHGGDTSPIGMRYFEYYNNVGNFNGYGDGTTFNMANGWVGFVRGGTFVYHDNNFPAISSQDYTKPDFQMSVFNLREGANNPSDACWGAGTAPGSLYHAPRQVGMGRVTGTGLDGKGRSTDESTYVGDSEPIYIWNNNRNPMNVAITDFNPPQAQCTAIGAVDTSLNYIKLNRDYFFSAKPSYTPFTYPHPLTASSAAPVLNFTPAIFGNQNLNTTSSPQVITITNNGNATETYTSIALSPSVFVNGNTGLAGQCSASGTILAGAHCTVSATFTPTVAQTYNGTITMTGTVTSSGTLTGTGTTAATIPSTPTNLATSVSGTAITLTWTASLGTPTITYSCQVSTTGSGGPFSAFATNLTSTTCLYTASGAGTFWFRVTASNSAGTSAPTAPVSGVVAATAAISNFAPSALNFPSNGVGVATSTNCSQSASCTIALSNIGNATLTITSISIAGTNAADFSTTPTCGGTLAPSASCNIPVVFTPSIIGVESASVILVSNDANSPESVPLSGTGFAPLGVDPSSQSLNFGNQFKGKTSAPQTVTLTNLSGVTLTFSSTPALTTGTQYAITVNTCGNGGSTLANGANCAITMTFTPTSNGVKTDTLTFAFTGAGGSPITVSLTGKGGNHGIFKGGTIVP